MQVKGNDTDANGQNPGALNSAETRKNQSGPAMKAFVRMMDTWDMSIDQRRAILGDIPKATYHKWASGNVGTLSRDQLERIGVTLGIFKGLSLIFNDEGGRLRWFKSNNHDYAFKGKSPAARMVDGGMSDLYAVREYLDGMRGAH